MNIILTILLILFLPTIIIVGTLLFFKMLTKASYNKGYNDALKNIEKRGDKQ